MRVLLTLFLIITMVLMIPTSGYAESNLSYDEKFVEVFGTNPYPYTAESPFTLDSNPNISDYDKHPINSKNNQTRKEGKSRPHQATDFRAQASDRVSSILDEGTVIYSSFQGTRTNGTAIYNNDVNAQEGKVIIKYPGNIYILYMHILPSVLKGNAVKKFTKIGVVDKKKVYGPHLHMARISDPEYPSKSKSMKLMPFYTNVRQWNYGYDLDVFAGDQLKGNVFTITGYFDDDVSGRADILSLKLYYRLPNGYRDSNNNIKDVNVWKKIVIKNKPINYKWKYDFNELKLPVGTKVEFYLAGDRYKTGDIKYSLWPQKYKRGPESPDQYKSAGKAPATFSFNIS